PAPARESGTSRAFSPAPEKPNLRKSASRACRSSTSPSAVVSDCTTEVRNTDKPAFREVTYRPLALPRQKRELTEDFAPAFFGRHRRPKALVVEERRSGEHTSELQ